MKLLQHVTRNRSSSMRYSTLDVGPNFGDRQDKLICNCDNKMRIIIATRCRLGKEKASCKELQFTTWPEQSPRPDFPAAQQPQGHMK